MSNAGEPGTVFVTGAGSGIGKATAASVRARGFEVIAAARDAAEADAIRADTGAESAVVAFDVTDRAATQRGCAEVLERLGSSRLAGVVNSAGVVIAGPMALLPDEDLRRQFDINVFGLMMVTRQLVPRLIADGGRLVNVGSISGRLSVPWTGAYSASKFALRAITDALRVELSSRGVRVALIEPGPVSTEIWGTSLSFGEQLRDKLGDAFEREYGAEADRVEAATREAQSRSIPVSHVAEAIVHALTARRPRAQYLVGGEARGQAMLARAPAAVRDRVLARALGIER
jgi:NAD(P)-dependent dehydrogenase (short-subunit alcohol dehydrogenase family)